MLKNFFCVYAIFKKKTKGDFMKRYDLAVIGGGFAGAAAAISAARAGLSVILVEKSNSLGGAAAVNLVNPFMPSRTKIKKDDREEIFELSQGLFMEIVEKLIGKDSFASKPAQVFREEYLKLILNRMAIEANVDLLFRTYLIGARVQDNKVEAIKIANKSGVSDIEADYFIDATGDADLAVMAGFPSRLGREKDGLCQPMTLCFRVANVDMEKFEKARPTLNKLYSEFQERGEIKNPRENILVFKSVMENTLHFNSTRIIKLNPVDAFDLTKAEIEAREQVFELFNFLRENVDGFQNAELTSTASEIGVRESRMIDGEYILTEKDLVECRAFEDSIALGNYDIDIHNPEGSGTSHYFFPDGQYYTIPYRSLIPKASQNLLVAGRCISATHEAQASIRIMPIVCCLGEAAGVATSIAKKDNVNVRDVDIQKLQDALRKNGAVL